jgi:hypothetical protein
MRIKMLRQTQAIFEIDGIEYVGLADGCGEVMSVYNRERLIHNYLVKPLTAIPMTDGKDNITMAMLGIAEVAIKSMNKQAARFQSPIYREELKCPA